MIRPFNAEDMLVILEAGVKEFGVKAQGTDALRELAEEREKNGMCLTAVDDGLITGCAGIDLMWAGVGEVWLLLTCNVDKYPRTLYNNIKEGLAKIIKDNDLFRVQAWGRIGFDRAHILFKHLKFKPEGIARKYTPDGVDAILYAKVK